MHRYAGFVTLLAVAAMFSVAGCGSSSPAAPTTPAATVTPPPGATAEMVAEGRALFNGGSCALCHGANGRNPTNGPDLTDRVFLHNNGNFEEIVQLITSGVPAANFKLPTSLPQFEMFPRGGMNLTDAQVRAIAAYVWTLSHPS